MKLIKPSGWKQYELIDVGGFEKLERFGPYILRRPEPQAVWSKNLAESEWRRLANGTFEQSSSHKGEWSFKDKKISDWEMEYPLAGKNLRFHLSLTRFKHVGIFPEQAANWTYIHEQVKRTGPDCKVLNLFAYTGGASLAARLAGADVVHVDSVKQVITWARRNMELSGLKDIRWVVEDAVKFVEREVKRGRRYNGIILDPPAYGIGAGGERWKLEESIDLLLQSLSNLLDDKRHFMILNTYSMGFSSVIIQNLLRSNYQNPDNLEVGELVVPATSGHVLPLGVIGRFSK